ncbi:MAG TPA: thiamine-phosphate kinase [Gammaproteobacteria bacterium]
MPGEFRIIEEFFSRDTKADGLVLGIGDDGAVLRPREGFDQVVATDTIVAGRHFPASLAAEDIGWRALAVNLSDIAAMGATPRFAFLNLTLANADTKWLRDFSRGFFELAEMSKTVLAGGDTTQGPLSITVTVIGEVPADEAITRSRAQPGDLVCVSGTPGDAAAGLELLMQGAGLDHPLVQRFRRPMPRLQLGANLRGRATAAIDISDGLLADLQHVLKASGVGARIELDRLPVSAALDEYSKDAKDFVLAGGDDYELCFCLPPAQLQVLQADDNGCEITVIGEIVAEPELAIVDADGKRYEPKRHGWEHFRMDAES